MGVVHLGADPHPRELLDKAGTNEMAAEHGAVGRLLGKMK